MLFITGHNCTVLCDLRLSSTHRYGHRLYIVVVLPVTPQSMIDIPQFSKNLCTDISQIWKHRCCRYQLYCNLILYMSTNFFLYLLIYLILLKCVQKQFFEMTTWPLTLGTFHELTNGSRFVVLYFYSVPFKLAAVWGDELIHDGLVT